jgi:hypothetical protein
MANQVMSTPLFKDGDRVRPISKSIGCTLAESFWAASSPNEESYMLVVKPYDINDKTEMKQCYNCEMPNNSGVGEMYCESDLVKIEPNINKLSIRKKEIGIKPIIPEIPSVDKCMIDNNLLHQISLAALMGATITFKKSEDVDGSILVQMQKKDDPKFAVLRINVMTCRDPESDAESRIIDFIYGT